MNEYTDYLEYKRLGLRDKANNCARSVVVAWEKTKDKDFAYQIAEDSNGHRINQILFNGIVYHVIKDGLNDNSKSIKCAINCIQNIYSDSAIHKSLGHITEAQLCSRLLKLDPNDAWAREKYIDVNMNWLGHCVHEWPSGILYGMNGANHDQCREILSEIGKLRELVVDNSDREYLNDVEGKVVAYMNR
jgi:hypothetical protein